MYDGNDGYYNDDGGGRRMRHRMLELAEKEAPLASVEAAAPGQLEAYNAEFWGEYNELQASRSLYENNYDVGDWNMCQRIYKYGVWCDEECRALDFFRIRRSAHAQHSLCVQHLWPGLSLIICANRFVTGAMIAHYRRFAKTILTANQISE
ncbi:expressed unknown protein [Seminavis robusta]|uniref:Uncharacterized protein n=1 Tax=Seminavis robusta TaxID=568900 RepID=A0A9N8DZS9_9STRA|nr:expressed unknown protein [Seminavis robusta]|eukprot:Sro408_g136790.1 n/a (151) ;mRNA; f:214-882